MKISLSQLESAVANPLEYAKSLVVSHKRGMSFTRNQVVRLAIYSYHSNQDSLDAASQYIQQVIANHPQLAGTEAIAIAQLADYETAFRALVSEGHVLSQIKARMRMPLRNITVTGQVARIDFTLQGPSEYAAWLLSGRSTDWEKELRMPLIQAWTAQEMGVDADQVAVGVYDLETGEHYRRCYSYAQISDAKLQVERLALEVNEHLNRIRSE